VKIKIICRVVFEIIPFSQMYCYVTENKGPKSLAFMTDVVAHETNNSNPKNKTTS
jgi:hypothetical protein